jgi:hypothetical protein
VVVGREGGQVSECRGACGGGKVELEGWEHFAWLLDWARQAGDARHKQPDILQGQILRVLCVTASRVANQGGWGGAAGSIVWQA